MAGPSTPPPINVLVSRIPGVWACCETLNSRPVCATPIGLPGHPSRCCPAGLIYGPFLGADLVEALFGFGKRTHEPGEGKSPGGRTGIPLNRVIRSLQLPLRPAGRAEPMGRTGPLLGT